MYDDEDFALALQLQEQMNEVSPVKPSCLDIPGTTPVKKSWNAANKENKNSSNKSSSLVDPSWEYIDPTPDVHAMFMQFNKRFFWEKLDSVEVRWSPRMTSCAGICCYQGRFGMCSIRLSLPLLKLRPRKDLVETLLHEMIHAFLFVTHNNRDRDGHGPEFHKHMYRINNEAGTRITVFHSFYDEVKLYKQHWWRCEGPCQRRPPFFGMVKRAMNRAPGPYDSWWAQHQATCGGKFVKVREPEGFKSKKKGKPPQSPSRDIRTYFGGKGNSLVSNNATGTSKNTTRIQKPVVPQNLFDTNRVNSVKDETKQKTVNKQNTKSIQGNSKTLGKASGSGFKSSQSGNNPNGAIKKGVAGFGGVLANKGSGTLVINTKGKYKNSTETERSSGVIKGNESTSASLPPDFVPFAGKGHTLPGGRKATGDKPWLARLDKLLSQQAKSPTLRPLSVACQNGSPKNVIPSTQLTPSSKRRTSGEEKSMKKTKISSSSLLNKWDSVVGKHLTAPSKVTSSYDRKLHKETGSYLKSDLGKSVSPSKNINGLLTSPNKSKKSNEKPSKKTESSVLDKWITVSPKKDSCSQLTPPSKETTSNDEKPLDDRETLSLLNSLYSGNHVDSLLTPPKKRTSNEEKPFREVGFFDLDNSVSPGRNMVTPPKKRMSNEEKPYKRAESSPNSNISKSFSADKNIISLLTPPSKSAFDKPKPQKETEIPLSLQSCSSGNNIMNSVQTPPSKRTTSDKPKPRKKTKILPNFDIDKSASPDDNKINLISPPSTSMNSEKSKLRTVSLEDTATCSSREVTCPSCNALVLEELLNAHLDSCLENVFTADEVEEIRYVTCPICETKVKESNLNSHMDECELCSQMVNNSDFMFGFGDATVDRSDTHNIIKCPMCNSELADCDLGSHLESCIGSAMTNDVIVIGDSDEEEELEDNKGELSYPCPCCTVMVKESLMNNHLDDCLSGVIIES